MPEHLRAQLGWTGGYAPLCREERNLAAIFYHLLLRGENLRRFLVLLGCPFPVHIEQTGLFFEYAYLRDLWQARARDPALAKRAILDWLSPPAHYALDGLSIEEWNTFFGASPRASSDTIQSPGRWSIDRFARNIAEDDFFLRTCKFKWAFNAKPDIVLHTSLDAAVCVEAKIESAEGYYPVRATEVAEFKRRGLARVGQTEVQTYLMGQLLGCQTMYVYLVRSPTALSKTHRTVTWKQAFAALDWQDEPAFVKAWIERA